MALILGTPELVHPDWVIGEQHIPKIQNLGNGTYVIIHDSDFFAMTGDDVVGQLYTADGTPIGDYVFLNSNRYLFQQYQDHDLTDDGRLLLGYDDQGFLTFRSFEATDLSAIELFGGGTTVQLLSVLDMIVPNINNAWMQILETAYFGSSVTQIMEVSYDSNGDTLFTNTVDFPADSLTTYQVIAREDGGWMRLYTTQVTPAAVTLTMWLQMLNDAGNADGGLITLPVAGKLLNAVTLSDGTVALLARTQTSGTAPTDIGIYVTLLDQDGAIVEASIESHFTTTMKDLDAKIEALPDGGFAVLTRQISMGDVPSYHLNIFNADGSERSGQIAIPYGGAENEQTFHLEVDANGNILAGWVEYDIHIDKTFVRAQVYDAQGNALSDVVDAWEIDSERTLEADFAAVAAGQFRVAFVDPTQNLGDVFQLLLDLDTDPSGAIVVLNAVEDTAYAFGASDFPFSDLDGGDFAEVEIMSLPATGELTLNGVAVAVGTRVDAADLGDLVWTPPADTSGSALAGFDYRLFDDEGNVSDTYALTFDVTSVQDVIVGTNAGETLTGTDEGDLIRAKKGDDILKGLRGDDEAKGGQGDDIVRGHQGDDLLKGNGQSDEVYGNLGADKLLGGNHDDILNGHQGRDILNGGKGDDALTGGGAIDTFIFRGNFGNDTITDFDALGANTDIIDFSHLSDVTGWNDLNNNHLTDGPDGVLITVGGFSVLLDGVSQAQLDSSQFLF